MAVSDPMTLSPITTQDGVLYCDGLVLPVQAADALARRHGFVYAEQLVHALEANPRFLDPSPGFEGAGSPL